MVLGNDSDAANTYSRLTEQEQTGRDLAFVPATAEVRVRPRFPQ